MGGRASLQDPLLILLKFECCVGIELFNLKDPMGLMQKTYLFSVHIRMPLTNASKSVGYTDTVLFPTIGNAVNVQLPGISNPDIFSETIRSVSSQFR
jgi:hypothetical protein